MAGHCRGHGAALAALTSARSLVAVSAFVWLYFIASNRYDTFINNDIMVRRTVRETNRPWFGLAICLGPHMPELTARRFINLSWSHFTDRYERHVLVHKKGRKRWGPDYVKINETHVSRIFFNASMTVDSVRTYEIFFGKWYNWTDDMLGIASEATVKVQRLMSSLRHILLRDEVPVPSTMSHTDMPYMFHYSFCRNYSFSIDYGYDDSVSRDAGRQFVHEISLNQQAYQELLKSGIAQYIDLYVYETGSFTEFPLISDHIPFRVDFSEHLLLSVVGEKRLKKSRSGIWECNTHARHQFTNCLTWCLMRGLLGSVDCITPMLVPFIYNTTGRVIDAKIQVGARKIHLPLRQVYPVYSAWPWMAEFSSLELCRNSKEFSAMFQLWQSTFFPRGNERYPISPNCHEECVPGCEMFDVVITQSGTKLVLSEDDMDNTTEPIHGVTFLHTTTLDWNEEQWIYNYRQLFIDMSGVLSFLLGMSAISICDWLFILCQWLMQKCGLLEIEHETPQEFEEILEEEKAASEASVEEDGVSPHLQPPNVVVQPPSTATIRHSSDEDAVDGEESDIMSSSSSEDDERGLLRRRRVSV